MKINDPKVVAEVEAAFAEYEAALVGNDVATLTRLFWKSPLTIRYGIAEILYGSDEIAAFRGARSPVGLARSLSRTVITTFGDDFATASTLFHRDTVPGKVGTADAELGASARGLADRRRPCEPDQRGLTAPG